jgi:Tol biopolymer transport system component
MARALAVPALAVLGCATAAASSSTPAHVGAGARTELAFASNALEGEDIYSVQADGGGLHVLEGDGSVDEDDPAWAPDGQELGYVVRSRTGDSSRVVIADAETLGIGGFGGRTVGGMHDSQPAWSPDGSRLAFVRENNEIWVERTDGSHAHRITYGDMPDWSPNGRHIAFVDTGGALSVVDPNGKHYKLLLAGGEIRVLLGTHAGGGSAFTPSWSPRGRWVAFVGAAEEWFGQFYWAPFEVRPDGKDPQLLPAPTGDNPVRSVAWQPTTSSLFAYGGTHIHIANPHTAAVTDVTPDLAGTTSRPTWRPVCDISGTPGGDRLRATKAKTLICGLAGNDRIKGGSGSDRLFGEAGNDVFHARGGGFDVIGCGPGRDTVFANRGDLVGADCERVFRGRR